MPQRPRSHRIEDESRAAFREALGSRMLFRDEHPDYGLDGDVEEFDGRDVATGLRFYVQLKATDETNLSRALRVSVPLDTAEYYRSLPLPVLMVRYHGPTKRLFTRWFHEFDPYYGGVGETSLTFRWVGEDVWDDLRPEKLIADARAFLELRSVSLPLPLDFFVATPPAGARGFYGIALASAIRAAAQKRPDIVRVRRGAAPPGAGLFEVKEDRLAVDLAGVSTATLHLSEDYDAGDHAALFGTDALVLLALAFEHLGQAELASRLAATYLVNCSIAAAPEVASALSSSMSRARRLTEALGVADQLDQADDEETRAVSFAFTLPAISHSSSLSDGEREHARLTMRKRMERREAAGDRSGAAAAAYTLANQHRNSAESVEAVSLYEAAATLDPTYLNRAYYNFELGGVLFGSQRYREAADAYRRALDLESDSFTKALWADALLFAGEYAEAREAFTSYADGLGEHASAETLYRSGEWLLKTVLLDFLVDELRVTHQNRNREAAEAVTAAATALEMHDRAPGLHLALEADLLCGPAWAGLGELHAADENLEVAKRDYLAAALCLEDHPELWTAAIIFELVTGGELAGLLMATGQRFCGENLVRALASFAEETGAVAGDPLFQAIEELLDSIPAGEDGGFTVRFVDEKTGEISEVWMHDGQANGNDGDDDDPGNGVGVA